jgi:hypothetical protein
MKIWAKGKCFSGLLNDKIGDGLPGVSGRAKRAKFGHILAGIMGEP